MGETTPPRSPLPPPLPPLSPSYARGSHIRTDILPTLLIFGIISHYIRSPIMDKKLKNEK